jgi:hypothetical protein
MGILKRQLDPRGPSTTHHNKLTEGGKAPKTCKSLHILELESNNMDVLKWSLNS